MKVIRIVMRRIKPGLLITGKGQYGIGYCLKTWKVKVIFPREKFNFFRTKIPIKPHKISTQPTSTTKPFRVRN